jgi:hypothetical protein
MNEKPLESFRDVVSHLTGYLPALLAGLGVVLLGWLVAWVGSKVLVRILILLRLDRVVGRFGWGGAMEKGDVRHSLFELLGTVFGVMIFLVFLDNAVAIWQLTVLSRLLESLLHLVPQLVTAAIILLVGVGIAAAVYRSVLRALLQEEFARAQLVARVIRASILVVTGSIALVQLEIAVPIVTGACLIAFGALALGFVLAFGLGSRRAVERMWEEKFRQRQEKPDQADAKPKSD